MSNQILYADSIRGVYIPQFFARFLPRGQIEGIDDADLEVLSWGPEKEGYWEAWENVLNNAVITRENGQKYTLYHDGDLWLVADTYEGRKGLAEMSNEPFNEET